MCQMTHNKKNDVFIITNKLNKELFHSLSTFPLLK